MRHFDVDWTNILSVLPVWESVPPPTRWVFVNELEPHGMSESRLGDHLKPLEEAGLVTRVQNNSRRLRVPDGLRPFRRVMRAMFRQQIFDEPNREILADYLKDNFTNQECCDFLGGRGYYYGPNYPLLIDLVTSAAWLEEFLGLSSMNDVREYESSYGGGDRQDISHFYRIEILQAVQKFLRGLMERKGPVAFGELGTVFSDLSRTQLQVALAGAIRYLLIFPALRSGDLTPVVGIWPEISRRLHRSQARLPEPVTPDVSFTMAFLMEDVAVLLATCAAEPVRLRATDYALFAKAQRDVESRLVDLPDWVSTVFRYPPEGRVSVAKAYSDQLGFATVKGREGRSLRMETTAKGMRWLGKGAKERTASFLDQFRRAAKKKPHWDYEGVSYLPWQISSGLDDELYRSFVDALKEGFGCLEDGVFVPMFSFAEYLGECQNPMLDWLDRQKPVHGLWASFDNIFYGHVPHFKRRAPSRESLEAKWGRNLVSFLAERLIPFGGASLGLASDEACIAINDVGRYLLGLAEDFEYQAGDEAEIVVQPNFEVVFLGPSPVLEASVGRIAERQGKGVGVLFKITKKSILAAAATGMTAAEAIRILKEASSKDLPPNVEREIVGWFGQCRRISMRRSILIQCPDAETAGRVRGAGGKNVTNITDTVLEFHDAKQRAQLLRKLKAIGVFAGPEGAD